MSARKMAVSSATALIYVILPVVAMVWGPTWMRRILHFPVSEERLLVGIINNDLDEVRAALSEGADVNAPLIGAQPSLSVAALEASRQIMIELLKAGADVSFADELGATALFRASMRGRSDAVELLLQAGADPNPQGWFKPLNIAALYGHVQVMELLLEGGANIEGIGCGGRTPLLDAALNGHVEAVCLLLAAGADITAVDDEHETAYLIALRGDYHKLASLLKNQVLGSTTVVKGARYLPGC